jgi:hypothetical protein
MHPINRQEYLEKEKPGATSRNGSHCVCLYRPVGSSGGQPFDQAVELLIAFDRLEERSQVNEAAEIGKGGPREGVPEY